jgi:AraC-like DNA-binding protein
LNESAIFAALVAMMRRMTADSRTVLQTVRDRDAVSMLRRHVACVWIQEVSPDSASFAHRKAPNGSAELVCALGSMPRILGPQTGPREEVLAPGTTIVGIRLRPAAASCVLGLPASELVDLDLSVDELWGKQTSALEEALATAGGPHEAAAILERTIADRLTGEAKLDSIAAAAVDRVMSAKPGTLSMLAASLCISERQLRRRCATAVGLAPKTLHRIFRFQRFLALAWTLETPSAHLARLAADAGYADQAHLTREAARLEGRSPRTLLLESEQRCGCGHDHAASYGPLLKPYTPSRAAV